MRKAVFSLGLLVLTSVQILVYGQNFISQEDALDWIGKNIESSTTVAIRQEASPTEYSYGNDIRYYRLSQIKGCKMILERYDKMEGKPMVKSVYELPLEEIDPDNIKMSIEKYSRNVCLVFKPENKAKIKVTKLSGKNYKNKRYVKKDVIIIEFNKESLSENIPGQMQKAFQYTIQKCNSYSSILNYLNNSMD